MAILRNIISYKHDRIFVLLIAISHSLKNYKYYYLKIYLHKATELCDKNEFA